MKLNSLIAIGFAATAFTGAWGADWYVDANNGNDVWDGTSAAIPSQEAIDAATAAGVAASGPRKTLHAMMSDERVVAGDTVNAAEGDYCEGGAVNGSKETVNRVQIKAGVTLTATQGRNNTFIIGSGGVFSSNQEINAYTNGAVRCVYFLSPPANAGYGYGIVKGFTLKDGRTANTNEHGGASYGYGLLVECDFQNNGCSKSDRGGTMHWGTALRCKFSSYARGYAGYTNTKIIDSLISSTSKFYNSCTAYNCTFSGDGYLRTGGKSYNCLFVGAGAANSDQTPKDQANTKHYNDFSRLEFNGCETDAFCRVVDKGETPYDPETFRPRVFSVAIDGGDISHYAKATNGWTAAWLAECGKDYYGGERVVNGKIDVGCGEMQMRDTVVTITDECGGLVVDGAEKGESSIGRGVTKDVVFSRTFTSDKLCLGVNVDGVFYSFGGTTSDIPQTVSLSWSLRHDYTIAAVYEENQKDWYVNPGPLGDDNNKGYHRLCPRKTLVRAMELASENSGNIVHAAAGNYDSFPEGYFSNNRVVVKEGVGLVADEWPEKKTIIVGAKDMESSDKDTNGNGAKAVRCVKVDGNGYIRGFKLIGGRTQRGDSTSARGGGAYLVSNAAIIDCEVTACGCAHRGRGIYAAGTAGAIIRTYAHDQACGSYDVYGGQMADSYVMGAKSGNSTFYSYYGSGPIINSTVLRGDARSQGANMKIINTYLMYASAPDSSSSVLTNCVFVNSKDKSVDGNCTYDPDTCKFGVSSTDLFDDNFRPKNTWSPLVDFGDRALYDKYFPANWVQFKTADIAGGQRICNGQIDVGCGEYDWRGDYAAKLNPKIEVASAGPDVVLVEQGVNIKAGDTLCLRVELRTSGTVALNIAGGATVTVDGAEIEGDSGVYAFAGEQGAVYEVVVTAGEVDAVLSSVVLPKRGTVVVVR